MIDQHAIKYATEYLDQQFAKGEQADLIGMLNHVDYFERVVMVLDEVNETLRQRPLVYFERIDGRITFNQSGGERELAKEDLDRNVRMYHEWFESFYNVRLNFRE